VGRPAQNYIQRYFKLNQAKLLAKMPKRQKENLL